MKLKILLIGPERSGKTTVANSLADPARESPQIYRPTIGARIMNCELGITMEGKRESIECKLWDLSGNAKFENVWPAAQHEADGIILVANGDVALKADEIENWIKNFPKKMRLSPQYCLGIANHPSGRVPPEAEPFTVLSVNFVHACFEERALTLIPAVGKLLAKIAEKNTVATNQNQSFAADN